jgi:hypothetical protein
MRKRLITLAGALVAAALVAAAGIAWTTGDREKPLSGQARNRAIASALRHTSGGAVTETEVGDDGAAYGVEVRLPDGTRVEVHLDERFNVIGDERDDDVGRPAVGRDLGARGHRLGDDGVKPRPHRLGHGREVAFEAVIARHLHDLPSPSGRRHPKRIPVSLDDKRRNRDRIELGQTTLRRLPGPARRR